MSLRQDGAHASLMAPNSGAQHMVLGASLRAAATSLSALVLHEAHGTGTALGGGLLRDAATCRGCSSHIRGACVGLKAQDEETGAQAPASACTAAQPDPPPWALPGGGRPGSDVCAPPVDLTVVERVAAERVAAERAAVERAAAERAAAERATAQAAARAAATGAATRDEADCRRRRRLLQCEVPVWV